MSNVFDRMLDAVSSIHRVETRLYPSESMHTAKPNLTPVIDEDFLEDVKLKVRTCTYTYTGF